MNLTIAQKFLMHQKIYRKDLKKQAEENCNLQLQIDYYITRLDLLETKLEGLQNKMNQNFSKYFPGSYNESTDGGELDDIPF